MSFYLRTNYARSLNESYMLNIAHKELVGHI